MSDNVIVLGAGFSRDAGIPLLQGFVEKMWEFSFKGRNDSDVALSSEDRQALVDAIDIKNELDGYHGRASFDDRNIEDVLSMLSFNMLGGGEEERSKMRRFVHAIARMIEVCCSVTHGGIEHGVPVTESGPDTYRKFWQGLFSLRDSGFDFPTLITMNYDLVLERSLYQVLNSTYYDGHKRRLGFSQFSIDYSYGHVPVRNFGLKYVSFRTVDLDRMQGVIMEPLMAEGQGLPIEILKLHGSVNFPEAAPSEGPFSHVNPLDDPYILPPISNKFVADEAESIWKTALERLRAAKNVIFVGYSLPATDVYMQYFLKAAFGPNKDLNRISVVDPMAEESNEQGQELRYRYASCFSPQLQNRIVFNPGGAFNAGSFADRLPHVPEEFFF